MKGNSKKIKCVVWDLDNTLWKGTLLEGDNLRLKENVVNVIKKLDGRGILNSIASKNEYKPAMEKLEEFAVKDYFLYPQINWNPKHISVKKITDSINIGIDSVAFIDDQHFELDEVKHYHSDVLCIHERDTNNILKMPEMNPLFITDESKIRRQMYTSDIKRNDTQESFEGSQEEFLKSLNMVFAISEATEEDLQRAEELTVRTHQLNTTGYTYSYDELNAFRLSDSHLLMVARLEDKYGSYGTIGLILVEMKEDRWIIKLLLMSCRVMSRGVGNVMINYLLSRAKKKGVRLLAELISTDRNRMMYMTYKFASFKEKEKKENLIILENDLTVIQKHPSYIELKAVE